MGLIKISKYIGNAHMTKAVNRRPKVSLESDDVILEDKNTTKVPNSGIKSINIAQYANPTDIAAISPIALSDSSVRNNGYDLAVLIILIINTGIKASSRGICTNISNVWRGL